MVLSLGVVPPRCKTLRDSSALDSLDSASHNLPVAFDIDIEKFSNTSDLKAAFAKDADLLAVASTTADLRVYSINSEDLQKDFYTKKYRSFSTSNPPFFTPKSSPINSLAISDDGKYLVAGSPEGLYFWRVSDKKTFVGRTLNLEGSYLIEGSSEYGGVDVSYPVFAKDNYLYYLQSRGRYLFQISLSEYEKNCVNVRVPAGICVKNKDYYSKLLSKDLRGKLKSIQTLFLNGVISVLTDTEEFFINLKETKATHAALKVRSDTTKLNYLSLSKDLYIYDGKQQFTPIRVSHDSEGMIFSRLLLSEGFVYAQNRNTLQVKEAKIKSYKISDRKPDTPVKIYFTPEMNVRIIYQSNRNNLKVLESKPIKPYLNRTANSKLKFRLVSRFLLPNEYHLKAILPLNEDKAAVLSHSGEVLLIDIRTTSKT